MAHRFFSFLRRPSHSLSSPRSADASRFTLDFLRQEIQQLESVKRVSATPSESAVKQEEKEEEMERSVEIVHPWPEWVELMDHLLKRGFLDPGTFHSSSSSCNISKYSNHIRTACLSFSRESSELIRWAVFFRMVGKVFVEMLLREKIGYFVGDVWSLISAFHPFILAWTQLHAELVGVAERHRLRTT